ncbi:MAG: hypothetical protein IPQ09_18630 [Myxococcales bacterium]|nr:hypothetical protein [Myxococcales bacterium]
MSPPSTPVEAPPSFAREVLEDASRLGAVVATSRTERGGEVVAWACVVAHEGALVGCAVARRDPKVVVALRVAESAEDAMRLARSLVLRSGKKLAEGALVPTELADVEDVALQRLAPQFAVAEAARFGLPLPYAWIAVGCTWSDMALDPASRAAAVLSLARAAAPTRGLTGGVMSPPDRAFEGLSRAFRKAKEPLLTTAAWTAQALVTEEPERVLALASSLVLLPGLAPERLELVGAVIDTLNPALVALASLRPRKAPPVVLARLRLPGGALGPGPIVVVYFYAAARHCGLFERYAEAPLGEAVTRAGFAHLDAVFERHEVVVRSALEATGEVTLQRGFHGAVSLEEAEASFEADGFAPVELVLDA